MGSRTFPYQTLRLGREMSGRETSGRKTSWNPHRYIKELGLSKKYPNTLEVHLSAAPKVPEFLSIGFGEPVTYDIASLATELLLLAWESM